MHYAIESQTSEANEPEWWINNDSNSPIIKGVYTVPLLTLKDVIEETLKTFSDANLASEAAQQRISGRILDELVHTLRFDCKTCHTKITEKRTPIDTSQELLWEDDWDLP